MSPLLFINIILTTFFLVCMIGIVYKSYRNGISPMPSNTAMRQAVAAEINKREVPSRIVDAGSGFGGLLRYFAPIHKQHYFTGIENSFFPYIIAKLIKLFLIGSSHNVNYSYSSILDYNYIDTDIVVCYLYPKGTQQLYEAIQLQNTNILFISVAFAVNHVMPIRTYTCSDLYRTKVYVYQLKPQH